MAQGLLVRKAKQEADQPVKHPVSRDLGANVDYVNRTLGVGVSYEVIFRRMRVDDVEIATWVINGFFQTFANIQILSQAGRRSAGENKEVNGAERPQGISEKSFQVLRELLDYRLGYSQVEVTPDLDAAILQVMCGPMIMLVDGEDTAIVIDTRYYPDRNPEEPLVEQVVRGPRDGFIENIIDNTALIRRRVRDPGLRFQLFKVGTRSQTDVAVGWIEGLTNPQLVERVKEGLQHANIDGVPMAEEAVAELFGQSPWNPLPMVRMTERPDVAAANLFDGHVLVVVDTTCEVIVVPVTFFQLLQHPEDYHVNPVLGTYLRWVEFIAFGLALVVPPVWLLLATHSGILVHFPFLSFIGVKKPSGLPLPLQFILAEIGIDILRRSILNSPGPLASTFGILGAVVFGSVATKVGIFTPEALVYVTFAAISAFAISNIELGMVTRLVRLSLLILEWAWALPGIILGLFFWFMLALRTESLGVPFLWPVLPFNWISLRSILVREPLTARNPRPIALHPINRYRGGEKV